jgi:pimeloyl-ACP methyl ester carboxylesterase
VPLETDLTTPLAYYLAHARLETSGYVGFFCPDCLADKAGIHTLEPYQPGKIPVVLIHGLLGSPLTWAPVYNDLLADPVLRKRYQFWVYFYATGTPYLLTAAHLRQELDKLRNDLDPRKEDAALDEMVVVGHSMGGLVSRLLTVDGGDDFWKLVSPVALASLKLEPQTRQELEATFYFRRCPGVRRAIFLATPHKGSKISPSPIGRVGDWLAGVPRAVALTAKDVAQNNPELAPTLGGRHLPTSIDLLDPASPALELLSYRPRPKEVHYHSVVGITPPTVLLVERLLGGGYRQPGDGVVPYASAHLDEAESELVVPSDHYHVHQHPLAVLEVRRILLEHLREVDGRLKGGNGEIILTKGAKR